ncbi:MAG: PspC domain-containing protein [Prevotella sp.]|nr:PspC domain-containing protein [Prevotella sp.]MCI7045431.1 PspC domain-containing protein [Prevotella sp.]MDD6817285.1 PspC domain-containing protein [Prevotellaceae bacterium]MDD6842202.1 PspC domain-containing protein [Prevotellaceae bacterium]MDY4891137.1 PspC domain-containing protein [Prevotella sp.]
MKKRLTLSDDRKLGGVCGGIAEYFDVDPTLIRIVYAALTLFTAFCGIILYPILYIIMPSKSKVL